MADNDTPETRIRRALFPKRRRVPKLDIPKKWYRKKEPTMNSKLRQEIMDVLPFDVDKDKADLILRTIFNVIADKILTEGKATIPHIGIFFLKYYRYRPNPRTGKLLPGAYKVRFKQTVKLRKELNQYLAEQEEKNGNSGTD